MSVSVDNYILQQHDESIRSMLYVLRDFIHHSIPDIKESIKWNIPFFEYSGNLCYLNVVKSTVILAFYQGKYLNDEYGVLNNDTKMIRKMTFSDIEQIESNSTIIHAYILQAKQINQQLWQKKKIP
jgi:hypothetical protein